MKIPLRAISIIPHERKAPTRIPAAAIQRIVFLEATLDPNEEFKKLTASLVTPTIRSTIAKAINKTMAHIQGLVRYAEKSI